jgi:hypothetical protein
MKRHLCMAVLVAALGVTLAPEREAGAVTYRMSAASCRAAANELNEWVDGDWFRFYLGGITAYCPMAAWAGQNVDVLYGIVYVSGEVGCRMRLTTESGSTYNSAWRYACDTNGGCSAPEPHTGSADLLINNPWATISNVLNMSYECNGDQFDTIRGYLIAQSES